VQVAAAVDMLAALEARMEALRKQVLAAARHLTGAKVRAARLYGVGPVTALALTCWLGGADRFSSSRKAVRFTGLDITVWSSDCKGLPGRLSRQGPPVLRWAVDEAGKTHARATAPDHGYYAQMKDRKNGKRAALSEARKIVRQEFVGALHGPRPIAGSSSPPAGSRPRPSPTRTGWRPGASCSTAWPERADGPLQHRRSGPADVRDQMRRRGLLRGKLTLKAQRPVERVVERVAAKSQCNTCFRCHPSRYLCRSCHQSERTGLS
jgi:hypothetical protein